MGVNQATTPDNYAALLNQNQLRALGAPAATGAYGPSEYGANTWNPNAINPEFTDWASKNQLALSGGWKGANNTSALTNSAGHVVAEGKAPGDDEFGLAALAAAGVITGGVALSGAGAGGGALGIPGATYAMPGAEAGFSLANAGAAAGSALPEVAGGDALASLLAGTSDIGIGAASAGGGAASAGIGSTALSGALPWLDIAKIATPLLGSALASGAARSAADTQSAATRDAIAENRRQADRSYTDQAPYRAAGVGALGQYQAELNKPTTAADVMSDPGYQFGLDQGQQALDRKFAASGGRFSGAMLKEASRFNAGTAAGGYSAAYQRGQDRLNRLASLAGLGQTSTQASAAAGANSTNAISGLIAQQGINGGSAQLAQGNIWGNAANQIGALYGRYSNQGPSTTTQPYNNGNSSGSDQFGWKGPGGF